MGDGSEQTYPLRRVFSRKCRLLQPVSLEQRVLTQQFSCYLQAAHLKELQQRAQRMNEPYGPATPRPMSSTSPSTMKMFMGFLTVFIVAQMIGTVLFCLYLHMKMDKVSGETGLSLPDCERDLPSAMERCAHQKDERGRGRCWPLNGRRSGIYCTCVLISALICHKGVR